MLKISMIATQGHPASKERHRGVDITPSHNEIGCGSTKGTIKLLSSPL
jgi:hypothetical protein